MDVAISTLGRTPAVATQFLSYLIDVANHDIGYLFLISTSDPIVYGGAKLVKKSIENRYGDLIVNILKTEAPDIDSEANLDSYINSLMGGLKNSILSSYREVDLIHLCVAGGRKNMAIISTIYSMIVRPVILYHIINVRVDVTRNQMEGLEDYLVKLAKTEDPSREDEIYNVLVESRNRYGESIDDILYPPRNDVKVIEMYIPPYPRDYMDFIRYILSKPEGYRVDDLKEIFRAADTYISSLVISKLVEIDSGYIKPTRNLLRFKPFFT